MVRFKQFFSLLFLFSLLSTAYTTPPSIARYSVLGANPDGNIAAFMLSHFGPSSHAPFATLIIKKAGQTEPLYQDGAYHLEGGEKELAELMDYLLEKNTNVLQNYKIDLNDPRISEANMVITDNHQPELISGWIDRARRGTKEFTVKSIPAENCPRHPHAIDLEFWFNGTNQLTSKQKEDSCWDNSFSIRNIYQTQKALWFVVNKLANDLAEQDVYFIDVQGIVLR